MLNRDVESAVLVVVLLVVGALSWWLTLRPVLEPDPTRFDALPERLNGWQSVEIEMDEGVSEMLAADHNVQRAYLHPQRYVVFFYLGYYGTRRGGTPEHTPDVCYPAQGWEILSAMDRSVGGDEGFDVREFVLEKDGERRLVHYWYRTSHATGITSTARLRLQHFWGRLTANRGDGALVRLSTLIEADDVEDARSRLYGLDVAFEHAVEDAWKTADAEPALSPTG
ncbi:MAG: EpsI family protein [Deltaproteobacteria bacterium]|nr:EpsI family protein [Deltaproteobacteria bacterium]